VCEWAWVEGEAYLFGSPLFFVFVLLPVFLTIVYGAWVSLIEALTVWDLIYTTPRR
jgi:hypothetical protein